ncbi:FAD-dependent oxidoreductase [Allosphingosinicella deserti]|uniref:Twin-arginine translocation pathway signal protein n=1 Tax=Allosphingosinicella deserti TaxID=2116704 RepID=A0A2P7QLU8_9SPHN|nr:NAD(P)/FAD-dependent oxidoreductase [Sphingomonas deserti]PSJ38948.1 twin-arginine translocation pathway signal protein [Sphingomonas deserti]
MKLSRRALVGGAAGAAVLAGGGWAALRRRKPPGTLAGADLARGHRLAKGGFPAPTRFEETGVVIAGGGVAGLSAAWTLAEAGFDGFTLFELEDETGGNARAGRNAVSAYPLGAHYLPVANQDARALRHLLTRLGIIVGEKGGLPVYDPYQICADLEERLFHQGRWHEGLIPRNGIGAQDRADLAAFDAAVTAFAAHRGRDGRPAFTIPAAYSSRDPDLLVLDTISFGRWLDDREWHSPVLRAHLRYAMRDDYGTEPDHVSAWAGIHYFAGRRGWAADGAGDKVLTWPEGNARLARAMAARVPGRIRRGRIVHAVARDGDRMWIDSFDVAREETVRTTATAAILAMPHFVAARVAPGEVRADKAFTYAPWLVANITVDRLPTGKGAQLAWDNVSATSESLGYVVATHQGPDARTAGTVLSWYMPLSAVEPASGRRQLLERPIEDWQSIVEDDLLLMNPDLEGAIRSIDVWRWGHAMVRPTPGFIWGAAQRAAETRPPVFLAHSDLSGLSLFEEAHYHGTRAAEAAMRHLRHPFESLL